MTKNPKSKGDKIAPGLAWCVARCRAMASMVLSVTLAMAVTGCDAREAAPKTPASEFAAPREPVGLTLSGYNYTNRYIDQFSVNGIGGGNLHVSTVTSGGTNVCCFSYTPGTPAPKTVKVKWQHGACEYKITTSDNETFSRMHSFFKTLEVPVDPKVPANPGYFEVHFYPDGHVEAAITEHQSGGRLHLDKDREDRSDYPRCPDDQKPKE
jgi:hypothetical protein